MLALVALLSLGGCQCEDPIDPDRDARYADVSNDANGADTTANSSTGDASDDAEGPTLARCGSNVVEETSVAGWTVSLHHTDGRWRADRTDATTGEGPRLVGPAACEGAEPVRAYEGEPAVRAAFGNFQIDMQAEEAAWVAPGDELPRFEASDGALSLVYLLADGSELDLVFDSDGTHLRIRAQHELDGAEFTIECGADESFFGLGTQVTGMDLRGGTYPLWTQEQGNSKPEGGGNFPLNNIPEAAYAPMGVWHSSAGYSAVVTHDGFSELDLCESADDRMTLRSHLENPGFVVIDGASPRERVRSVTDYTGRVRADVPDWMFGLWVDSVTGPDRLQTVTDTLRTNGIPASAIWSEDWIGGSSTRFGFRLSYEWSWDPATYPDLKATVENLHARGFAFLGYFNPFVPDTASTWDEAVANDYLVSDEMGEPIVFLDPAFRNASLVDLFDPDAREWLGDFQQAAVTEIGLDGWMADFAEWYPLEAPDGWARHNLYPLEWQRANAENLAVPKEDLGEPGNHLFFPRSGWASVNGGSGGIVPAMWGGDQNTSWDYGDGFPTIIPIGAHVGLSGVPIFGSDIAGYNSIGPIDNTDKELWFRWASAAAFHPLMRTHHGGDECNNWNFDRDEETLDHIRRWSTVHSMLLPEFRRLHTEAATHGWPISRHPWLVEPTLTRMWSGDGYQWFLGDDILVAPVLQEGATSRTVVVGDADWWPLFGDAVASSVDEPNTTGIEVEVPASVTEVPVFVRGGRALVLLAEAPDTFYGATEPGITDLDDVDSYRVALYPDPAGGALSASDVPFAVGARRVDRFTLDGVVEWNGEELGDCAGDFSVSCVDGDTAVLVDVTSGTLAAGGGTVDVDSPTPVDLRIGVAGAAWGELASPTTYAPNPDAPSWCPPEE